MSLFTSICSFAFRLSPRSLYMTRSSQINLCLFKPSHSILLLLLLISSVTHTPKGQCVCLRGTRGVALLLFQFCSPIQPYKQHKSETPNTTMNSDLFKCYASVKATLNTRANTTHTASDTSSATDLRFWLFGEKKQFFNFIGLFIKPYCKK